MRHPFTIIAPAMTFIRLCTALCLASAAHAAHAEPAPLFAITAPDHWFKEIERRDNASTVEALAPSGSVAAKSMFLLSGSCALLKHRGKEAFLIEYLSKDPVRFTVRFVPGDRAGDAAQPFKPGAPVSRQRCELVDAIGAARR